MYLFIGTVSPVASSIRLRWLVLNEMYTPSAPAGMTTRLPQRTGNSSGLAILMKPAARLLLVLFMFFLSALVSFFMP